MESRSAFTLDRSGLDTLISTLAARGYRVMGPVSRDGAIVLDEISAVADLPAGLVEEQAPGRYRLRKEGSALFAHTVGPHPWRRLLYPTREVVLRLQRKNGSYAVVPGAEAEAPLALFSIRPCDLAALALLDRALPTDPRYVARRNAAFVVAVSCAQPGGTCFCASQGTGPQATQGFDLALTEIGARYVVEAGTARGAEVAKALSARAATAEERAEAMGAIEQAALHMGRTLAAAGLPAAISAAAESAHWEAVGQRCLGCGNCTSVCPTCFCSTIEDGCDLAGTCMERQRRADSCFTLGFSYVHGGSLRRSAGARYRQWLTHKLAGGAGYGEGNPGCVGCGRCIAWCPAGIDVTEEAAAITGSRTDEQRRTGPRAGILSPAGR